MQSLIAEKPRDYVKVLEEYKRLLRLEVEKRHARIESAAELDQAAREQIVANLKKQIRRRSNDASSQLIRALLGGVRIRVGSDVWDGSVRNRLQRLQQQL